MKPYTNNLVKKIHDMDDETFKNYLLKKINKKMFREETWNAIVFRLDVLHAKE